MSTQKAAEIAARFDRLPPSRTVWTMVIRIGSPGAAVLWTLRRKVPESPRWLARHGRIEAAERIVAEIERRVAAEKGVVLPAPQPVAPEQTGTGSYKEIFGPRYRTRTLLLSNQSLTAAKERPG